MDETVTNDNETPKPHNNAELEPDFSILEENDGSYDNDELKRRLDIIAQLNHQEITSDLGVRLNEGKTILPAGTLMHTIEYSPGELDIISQFGIINPQIFEGWEEADPNSSVSFYRVRKENALQETIKELEANNITTQKRTKLVTFIIDGKIAEVQPLLPGSITNEDSSVTILGGLPRTAIVGIVLSSGLHNDTEVAPTLRSMFDTKVPILKEDGEKMTDDEIALLILSDLYNIGATKPLGYLPISTIEELGNKDLKTAIAELEVKGLTTKVVSEEKGTVLSGALYAYDREALGKLLAENQGIMEANGWTINPDDFVERIAREDVEDGDLYNVIAQAFSDRRPEYSEAQN